MTEKSKAIAEDSAPATASARGVYDINRIRGFLPHRYPFLLVDRIIEVDIEGEEKRIVGIKNVSVNELFFQGHFPDNPVMPGVLTLEAMGQVGCVMMALEQERLGLPLDGNMIFLTSVYSAKFRRPVVPGDQLRTEATLIRRRGPMGKMRFVGTVDGEVVCEAEMGFALGTALPSASQSGEGV